MIMLITLKRLFNGFSGWKLLFDFSYFFALLWQNSYIWSSFCWFEYVSSCLFPRFLFSWTLSIIFFICISSKYRLVKNASSIGWLKLLAILLFCYGGERVCQKPIRPKTTEILRSNLVITKNIYLGLINIIRKTE